MLELIDYDADGEQIVRKAVDRMTRSAGAPIEVEVGRLGLTEEPVRHYSLPSRPQKNSSPRAKSRSIVATTELDALLPDDLRDVLRAPLRTMVPMGTLERLRAREEQERAVQSEIAL